MIFDARHRFLKRSGKYFQRILVPFLLFTLVSGALMCVCLPAFAQSVTRKSPEQIKADLDRILADPEFQTTTETHDDSAYTRFLKWLSEEWGKFLKWLGGLFKFRMGTGSVGGGGLQWIFIILFGLLAAWLIYKLTKAYLANRKEKAQAEHTVFDFDELVEPIEREPDVWLRQAQEFADAGDYRKALRAVYVAVLMGLDQAQIIGFARARTNGEYARTLRRKNLPVLHDILRPLTDLFEPRWYSDEPTTESDYQDSRKAYKQMKEAIAALSPTLADSSDSGKPTPPVQSERGGKTGPDRPGREKTGQTAPEGAA